MTHARKPSTDLPPPQLPGDAPPAASGLLQAARRAIGERDWPAARELCRLLLDEPGQRYEGLDLSAAAALGEGRAREALTLAETAIGEAAEAPRGYLRRGAARLALGERAGAEEDFARAALLDPALPAARQALGLVRLDRGADGAAERDFEAALALHPQADRGAAVSLWGRARARLALGSPAAARRDLEAALAVDPGHSPSRLALAALARAAGDWPEAERQLREALAREEKGATGADARMALVDLLRRLGRLEEALGLLLRGTTGAAPALDARQRRALARLAADRRLVSLRMAPELRVRLAAELAAAFDDPAVDPQDPMVATAALALIDERCDAFWRTVAKGASSAAAPPEEAGPVARLLLRALESALVADLELERRLLALRRGLLEEKSPASSPWRLEAVCALAGQFFLGHYLHPLDSAEAAGAERWRRRLAEDFAELARRPSQATAERLAATGFTAAVAALASPLAPLAAAAGLGRGELEALGRVSPALGRLLLRQVAEPAAERRLAAALRAASWREHPSSGPVKRQYESQPYPLWTGLRLEAEARSPGAVLRRLFAQPEPPAFLDGPCSVLVAGCGTGQQAIAAACRFRRATILAIDLSAESLAYAQRMAVKYGPLIEAAGSSLEFRRADLLELAPEEGLFEIVLCTGVLHHLADPEAGWRHLRSLVQPGGVLKVGLYSRAARRGLAAARALLDGLPAVAAAGDAEAADAAVRAARARLAAGPEAARLARFVDFFSLVGCRDLLLHVRERSYSLPEIAAMMDRLALRFLGFELPREETAELYSTLYPADLGRLDLGNWAALEAAWPDTFADMYQLWCQAPSASQ